MTRVLLAALVWFGALVPGATAIVPTDGKTVPRGTLIHSPACAMTTNGHPQSPVNGDRYEWRAEFATLVGPSGWAGDITAPECTPIAAGALGNYTLRVMKAHKVQELNLGTWFTVKDESATVKTIRFTVDDTPVCMRFKSATDQRGKPLSPEQLREIGLPNKELRDGGVVTVAKNSAVQGVILETLRGDVLRVSPRSSFGLVAGCKSPREPRDVRFQIHVILGTIWAKIGPAQKGRPGWDAMLTQNAVTGVRGTEYGVSYDPALRRTTVRVKHGRVLVRKPRAKTGVMLTRGQRAMRQGTGRIRRH